MKYGVVLKQVAIAASIVMLASCGGGDDAEAGSPEDFHVTPDELKVTVTGTGTGCATDTTKRFWFTVVGGAGPYRIKSSDTALIPDRATVARQGDQFSITLDGGCFEPAVISVLDANNRETVVEVSNVREDAT